VVDEEHGKAAVTFFRKLNTTEVNGRIVTRMELSPQTGRTHQLRVHCAHHSGLGCPIVGDELYGTANNRLYLHAETLTVKHPQSGKTMRFKAEAGF
jgi:tRNA pseudouridine32 synthase/23S rRNA pseudouridine746 synthase